MKGRSSRLPIADPPDDWVNGSWTVDCICGVNFDDGEEMVNCDECGVWVHTRCSRFVRGEKSFACDKCKSKATKNDSEETEVAQLLVELPTKTIKLNNPYPLNNPPPRRPYRLWTDRPMEQRVHAQGIPGGDSALFQGLSSIFSSELWRCTGYIPKKFNFCYREFPCWDNQQHDISVKPEEDIENPVDKGAGVLYSLSKETAPASHTPTLVNMKSQVKAGGSEKKASKDRKSEGREFKNSNMQNMVNKEKLRPIVLHCGKRSREEFTHSKDQNGKKKTKLLYKEQGSKRDKAHTCRTVNLHSMSPRQLEGHDGKAVKADASDDKHGLVKNAGLQEAASDAPLNEISSTEKPKKDAAFDEGELAPRFCGVSGRGCTSDERSKAEKFSQDASDEVHKSAKIEVVHLPSLENYNNVNTSVKEEGLILHNMVTNQAHADLLTCDTLKSRPSVDYLANSALENEDSDIEKNLENNLLLGSVNCNSKSKLDADLENLKGILRGHSSNAPCSDASEDLSEHTLATDHKLDNVQVIETTAPSCQSREHEEQEGDKCVKVSDCQYEKNDETKKSCNSKLECEGSERSVEIPNIQSDSKEAPCVVGEMSQPSCVPAGKSSSSSATVLISRSSISDNNKSGNPQSPIITSKRMASSSSFSTKKETTFADPIKDEEKSEKTKNTMKDSQKSSLNPILKASQPSKTSSSSVYKHHTSIGRDSFRHPSSKSTLVESSFVPSGVSESAASLQTRHALSMQNRTVTPAGQHRGDKVSQVSLQSSSKPSQSSLGNLPASSNSPAGLSDEELALLLHQELNSSPRVPRVPRVRQIGSLPQPSSASAASILVKRTSTSGAKDQQMSSRRKSKDAHKDVPRSSRELDNDSRKVDRVPSSPDSAKNSDALTQVEANGELLHSAENNVESISTSAASDAPLSNNANGKKSTSNKDFQVNNSEDDTGTNRGVASTHHTLPGLIAEIMGKGKRMTYEQLCNAVLPHWPNLRKQNGERYAYPSHSQGVLDCLRNRSEWAQLVDRGPKTNASRSKRKIDAEVSFMESEDGEDRILKDRESKSFESSKEDFPKRRRNARKRRNIALQGGCVKKERRRRKLEIGSDDSASSSNSSEGSVSSEEESQGSGMCTAKSEVSASTDD